MGPISGKLALPTALVSHVFLTTPCWRNIAISLIEVQKKNPLLAISGYEGRVDTLINQKPRGGPHSLCRFSPGFMESNVQAL
jgi:hypothetical protein